MNTNRLPGHTLAQEGRMWTYGGWRSAASGPGQCSCGARSEDYETAAARKRWHREHKDAIRVQEGALA